MIKMIKLHIVYLGVLPKGEYSPLSHHSSLLQEAVDASFQSQALVRSYSRSFNAFAAYLTDQECQRMFSRDGVVSVFRSRILQPQTTRSWDFTGLSADIRRNPTIESDVIVGVLDTGIWLESKSFSDEGFGPAPKKWKGACKGGTNFTYNNKLIGARYYADDNSARDTYGHGTHTASTAAGIVVQNPSFYGLARGTARGGVPSARIAAYKVCGQYRCFDADILAGFDDAITDGVDIITISLGDDSANDLFSDSIAIGSFHAMEMGILTVNCAGNNGFKPGKVSSVAPWMLTVAASTIDRRVVDKLVLGNGKIFVGNVVNSFERDGKEFPLVYAKDVSRKCRGGSRTECYPQCLDENLVKGKIILCRSPEGSFAAKMFGASGSILPYDKSNDTSDVVPLPTALLNKANIELVRSYIHSTKNPKASISKSKAIRDYDAPIVASFSSKGPNAIVPDILKPDITAPGVEILAAFSPAGSPSDISLDTRSLKYNIISGTSMSCPHAAGAVAYVKSLHPEWSAAALKSALMTTALRMDATKNREAEFAYGAGNIDPVKATNPGLVYDTLKDDYIQMLCNLKYDDRMISKLTGHNNNCPKGTDGTAKDLNQPSMTAQVKVKPFKVEFRRTVTNVGAASSTYKATVSKPPQLSVSVEPSSLSCRSLNEKKSFVVNVSGNDLELMASASLVWSDGTHSVRSPIVLYPDTKIHFP